MSPAMKDSKASASPTGVQDLSPAAAHEVFTVQARLLDVMARHGFHRVRTPSFDRVEGLRRELDPASARRPAYFRLVDPESGEVVALRTDVTPQVARLVATQLDPRDAPFRLCYSALVYRPRARYGIAPREIPQAGAELMGEPGPEAEVEMLELAAACLQTLGLSSWALAVSHIGILKGLLEAASRRAPADPGRLRRALEAACHRKDRGAIRELVADPGLRADFDRVLVGVGPATVLDGLRLPSGGEEVAASLDSLRETLALADARLPDVPIVVDLSAERGLDYYTGLSFAGLVQSAPRPVISGGRYDTLLPRFGCDLPAIGFAVDEQAALDAMVAQGAAAVLPPRDVLVAGAGPAADALTRALRELPEAVSVVRSLHESSWRGESEDGIATRMARRRFRLVVFAQGPGAYELVRADGRRECATLDDVLASAVAERETI